MAYSETIVKPNRIIVANFDASGQNTTPLHVTPGDWIGVHISITSGTGTFQVQFAPFGTTTYAPTTVDGSADISASRAFAGFAAGEGTVRVTSTAGSSLVAVVTLSKQSSTGAA